MGTRALRSRVILDKELAAKLARTHRVFNERLPSLIGPLFKMRRGEQGDTPQLRQLYRTAGLYITNYSSQNAEYLMNSISMEGWTRNTALRYKPVLISDGDGDSVEISPSDWVDSVAELSCRRVLVFDKELVHGDLPGCMRQMLAREAVTIISGHDELTVLWEKAHREWMEQKRQWEADPINQRYLALRSRFLAFEEEVEGTVRKRRGRWHLYRQWLASNPDLAAWRGAKAEVNPLSDDARQRVADARLSRRASVEAKEFWAANPELEALDRLHGQYEREFVRRRKTKRNPDGFLHRPTFTMPDYLLHPRWFVFNAPQANPSGWRNLVLPKSPEELGSIELLLLSGEKLGDSYPTAWTPVRFRADPRLAGIRVTRRSHKVARGRKKGEVIEKPGYEWYDNQLRLWRPVDLSGTKLMLDFSRDRQVTGAHLLFTCGMDDLPLTDRAKLTKSVETGELTKKGAKKRKRMVAEGLVMLGVDIGLRHIGFAVLGEWKDGNLGILRSKTVDLAATEASGSHIGRNSAGPTLEHLAEHKRALRRLRRLRGKPVAGERSHSDLQAHIDHVADDRYKKAARQIVNLAVNAASESSRKTGQRYPRADIIVLENLENLVPDAERERGINRALVSFNRGHLVERVRQLAQDAGLKVFEVSPVGTSQVCHRCGRLGRRYSIVRKEDEKGRRWKSTIVFGEVEKLFACPHCRNGAGHVLTCNSDHNAAVNLLRRFTDDASAVAAYCGLTREARKEQQKGIEQVLYPELQRLHGLVETPW